MLDSEPSTELTRRTRRLHLHHAWRISRWLFLVGLAAALAVGGWKFHAWQQQRHATAFLREAIRAERENRPGDAMLAAQGCVQLAPDELRAYWLWAVLLRRDNQLAAADACLTRMVDANPHDGRAYGFRARHLLETGRAAEGDADLSRALELAPLDRDVLLLGAERRLAQDQLAAAREFAGRLRQNHRDDAAISGRLGALESALGMRRHAIESYRTALESDPKNASLLAEFVDLLCQERRFNEVRSVLARAAGLEHDAAVLQVLEARLEHAQGHWSSALRRLEKVKLGPSVTAAVVQQRWALEGDCQAHLGNQSGQLDAWRKAVKAEPRAVAMRRQLADALASAGQIEEAVAEARKVAADGGGLHDELLLAHLLIRAARLVPAERRKWDEPEAMVAAVRKRRSDLALGDQVAVDLLRAELLLAQGRASAAAEVFPLPASQWPRRLECWLARARIAATEDDGLVVFDWLKSARQTLGDSSAWRRAAAAYLFWQLGPAAAPQLRELGADVEKFTPAERRELLSALAWACLRCGDLEAAAKFSDEAIGKGGGPVEWLLQFETALRGKRLGVLDLLLKQVEQAVGNGAYWQYGKAVQLTLLARTGQPQLLRTAAEHAKQACRLAPGWSYAALLAGDIEADDRRPAAACRWYSQALRCGESRPAMVRRILGYLDSQQQYVEVDQAMRRLGRTAGPVLTSSVGGDFAVTLPVDDCASARRVAAQAAQQSASTENLVWLARLLEISAARSDAVPAHAAADRKLAENLLQKAVTAEPASTAAQMARVQFYVRTERMPQARAALDAAVAKVSAEERVYVQADGEQLLGNYREADRLWSKALVTGASERIRTRALEYLQRVGGTDRVRSELEAALNATPPLSGDDSIAVRRRLAWELTARGGAEDRRRADRLLAENLAVRPGNPLDEQLRALTRASGEKEGWRRSAIELLERLAAVDWRTRPEEKLFLSQLCLAEGDQQRASRHLKELVTYLPNEPRYVAALIELLVQRDAVAEAAQHAARMETLAPESLLTASSLAEVAVAQGRAADVPGIFQRFLVRPHREPADPVVCLEQVVACLDRLAARPKAKQAAILSKTAAALRQELIARDPLAALRWAANLTRQGRVDDAVAAVQASLARLKPDSLAETLSEMALAAASPAQQAAMERLFTAALTQHNRSAPLLTAAALFYTQRLQYDRAEAAFREAIDRSPAHVPALNNLALHLALLRRNPDEALELVQRAIQIAGEKPGLLDTRAVVQLARGQTDQALADLDRAMVIGPRATWCFHKARVWEARHDRPAAERADAEARELGLDVARLHPLEQAGIRARSKRP